MISKKHTLYDISVVLGKESIDYPGDTPYSRELLLTLKEGGFCDLSSLRLSAHSGTHIDAPAHFITDGKTIDQYGVESFILPAHVIDVGNAKVVTAEHLSNHDIQPGEAVLFKTDNSRNGLCCNGQFSEDYVYIAEDAATKCVELDISLVGLDYVTIEAYADEDFPTHSTLLSNGILILEGINLIDVPEGKYTLLCFPLRMHEAEASPVRAILMK